MLERTFRTDLTGNELLILDVLFDTDSGLETLSDEGIEDVFGVSLKHGLDHEKLTDLVVGMEDRGLLRIGIEGEEYSEVGLTELGGELWETERRPDWALYCVRSSFPPYPGSWVEVSIRSPSLATARRLLETHLDCRVLQDFRDRRELTHESSALVPWRTFAHVDELRGRGKIGAFLDWGCLERNRSWWSNVVELQRFVGT